MVLENGTALQVCPNDILCALMIKNSENYLPKSLRLASVTYSCKHFGVHKTRSKGIRPVQNVLPSGCNFQIQFVYDRRLDAYVVKKSIIEHNHPISAAIAKHYPCNRRLDANECQEALTLLDVGGNTTLVRNYFETKTGKVVTNQDIQNMKRKSEHPNQSEESKIFSTLSKFLEAHVDNIACVVLDDDEKTIELIYIQSYLQRQCFEKFPELIMVDGTYKINNAGMCLYDILVEDGCGDSRVVAYCFVSQETKISIVNFSQIFKRCNSKCEEVKVALTNKDFIEIVAIEQEFPQYPRNNLMGRSWINEISMNYP